MSSERSIGRLSRYRRVLNELLHDSVSHVYSYQLASRAGGNAAQVRYDLMAIGYSGSPNSGYDVQGLLKSIEAFMDAPEGTRVALVGVGNVGRALLAYFAGRRTSLTIAAAFDRDPAKASHVLHGCRCYAQTELEAVVRREDIRVGIVAVPAAQAQQVADKLVTAGVTGLLNFAPVPLRVPVDVFVEDIDMTMALEKVAYFARHTPRRKRTRNHEHHHQTTER